MFKPLASLCLKGNYTHPISLNTNNLILVHVNVFCDANLRLENIFLKIPFYTFIPVVLPVSKGLPQISSQMMGASYSSS